MPVAWRLESPFGISVDLQAIYMYLRRADVMSLTNLKKIKIKNMFKKERMEKEMAIREVQTQSKLITS